MIMNNSVTDNSFDGLLNLVAPMPRFVVGRSRPRERISTAERPRRRPTKEEKLSRKNKYATALANFRLKRSISTMQVIAVRGQHKSVVAKDKKSLPGLTGVLDADGLAVLVADDPTLRLMRNAVFCCIDPYIRTFWDSIAVVDGCVIIDD